MKKENIIHNGKDKKMINDLNILVGCKIRINNIEGKPSAAGLVGTVTSVDDQCILHGTWSSIGVLYLEDDITILD